MRRLIVNADDFGMTRGINRAIVEASGRGIVTSTTLMATAPAFADAIALAPSLPSASIGCHVILLDGTPVLPPDRVPSLLQSDNANSEFRVTLPDFARATFSRRLNPAEVEAEAAAQMGRIQDAGISLSHFDCHKHAHMFPAVLQPVLRAARSCGITAVRNPFGPLIPLPVSRILGNLKLWQRTAELAVLRAFAGNFRREAQRYGLRTPDGCVGVLNTGSLDLDTFLIIVENLPTGTWEFVCHPGYNDDELGTVRTRLRESRQTELAVLTSPEARAALERRGVELISFRDL